MFGNQECSRNYLAEPRGLGAPFPQDTAIPIARISVFDNQDQQNCKIANTVIWQFTVFFLITKYLAENIIIYLKIYEEYILHVLVMMHKNKQTLVH